MYIKSLHEISEELKTHSIVEAKLTYAEIIDIILKSLEDPEAEAGGCGGYSGSRRFLCHSLSAGHAGEEGYPCGHGSGSRVCGKDVPGERRVWPRHRLPGRINEKSHICLNPRQAGSPAFLLVAAGILFYLTCHFDCFILD